MTTDFKIGDYVEHCSLMPGVLMAINGRHVEIRILDDLNYSGDGFSNCSIEHCATRKLSYEQVKMMIALGKERLSEIYKLKSQTSDKSYEEYDRLIKEAYLKMMNNQ